MSSPVSGPWMVTYSAASPSTPRVGKQRGTWHSATPHKLRSPQEDVPSLQITHFTKKQIVCFDVVKFGKSRKRLLKLINPHDYPQTVELERISPKKGFFLNDKIWDIPANEELLVPIFWTPPEEGNFRDLITFLCEGAFRLQVILLGTAEDASKKVSGRRSTFWVKRKSMARPLRTQNGLGIMKKKERSLHISPKLADKENFTSTDGDYLPKIDISNSGIQRETMVIKGDGNVMFHARFNDDERKENSPKKELIFSKHTTGIVLRELQNAVEPVQNVPLQNVARETLVMCKGMSPFLVSKKSKARPTKRNDVGNLDMSKTPRDVGRELKGTEVKARHSSDNRKSLVRITKRNLFSDAEFCSETKNKQSDEIRVIKSDGGNSSETRGDDPMEKSIDDGEHGIDDEGGKDGDHDSDEFDDSLEAKPNQKQDIEEASVVPQETITKETREAAADGDGNISELRSREECSREKASGDDASLRWKVKGVQDEGSEIGDAQPEKTDDTRSIESTTVLSREEGEKDKDEIVKAEEGEKTKDVKKDDESKKLLTGCEMIIKRAEETIVHQKESGIMSEVTLGNKQEDAESRETDGDCQEEAEDLAVASPSSVMDGETVSLSTVATVDVDVREGIDETTGKHYERKNEDVAEAKKQGLLFIPLDDDIGKSKKRSSDEHDVTAVKKLKTSVPQGTAGSRPTQGRKSSLSLNRTVALRRAAATNGSVTGGSRTKPRVKKVMKGVPMAKLNLMRPAKTALPRHPMPFAAKNMFYDERWIDKQERGFVQWLNYILTPEEGGVTNPSIKGKKIEASALAVSSSTTIKPAPTKEVLSMRAYTARRRLNQLRRGACMLFQSEPVVRVIQHVEAQVEKGRLTVRTDRKIHADLGMKQNILMMILSYNPLWLRIGLETIYGELLPIEDNSDVIGLSRFIVTRLLSNPDIADQFSHPTVPGLFRPGYELTLAKFTLKKFLLLVFFLDKAKLTRLIDHNPCLFCKDAQYKSSRDLLLEFSRDYLRGEGDITRHLNYIGYSVTHVQKALDEFDFAVLNLAKDLRDGIRLVRVTELLTKNWLLSHELRCPAISRLQKVHNVQVSMYALATTCTDLSDGGVDAKSIVDGHREKTLQLLWSIIFAFKVVTMLDEAQLKEETSFLWNNLKLRQKLDSVKMLTLMRAKKRDEATDDVYFKSPKLSLLLKWCQAVCAYYSVQVDNFTVSFCDGRALCYLVHHYHPELINAASIRDETTQVEALREETGSDDSCDGGDLSQSFSSMCGEKSSFDQLKKNEGENFKTLYHAMKSLGGVPFMIKSADMSGTIPDEKVVITYVSYLCARLLDLCQETRAVRTIQTAWRNYQLKKKIQEREVRCRAAIVIQRRVREFLRNQQLKQKESAVVCLQMAVRGWQARRKLATLRRKKLEKQRTSAVIILQAHVRRHRAQKEFTARLRAVTRIQGFARGMKVRKDMERSKKAVRVIEDYYRGHRERTRTQEKYQQTRRSVITIQAFTRGFQARKLYRQTKAARRIQAIWRGRLVRKRLASESRAVVVIQSAWRMYSQKRRYRGLLSATRLIQLWYRAVLLGRRERLAYLTKCESALKIQSSFRGYRARKAYLRERQRCILVQSLVRRHIERKKYLQLRRSAVLIQRRHRATVLAKRESQKYELKRSAVLKIQGVVRGWLVRRDLKQREAAVHVLQAWIRGRRQRERYNKTKRACILLQSHVRAYQERRNYCRLQEAVLVLQKIYRGRQARLVVRRIRSAIKIQAAYRMYKAKCNYKSEIAKVVACQSVIRCFIQRRKYNKVLNSVSLIQKHYRGWQKMRTSQMIYTAMRQATVTIQAAYRGYRVRRNYVRTLKNVTICQSLVRTFLAKRRFARKKNAALIIQEHFRGWQTMRTSQTRYAAMRQATVTIQALYRGYRARRNYAQTIRNVTICESLVRTFLARRRFVKKKNAALVIQKHFRSWQKMRSSQMRYAAMRRATVTIQAAYRGYRVRRNYVRTIKNVTICQSLVRTFLAKERFAKKKNATLIIQEHFRGWQKMRTLQMRYTAMRQATVTIQALYRAYRARRNYAHTIRNVTICQSLVRTFLARRRFVKKKNAALVIQKHFRSWQKMKSSQMRYAAMRRATVTIQALYRGYRARRNYVRTIRNVTICQSLVRTFLAKRRFERKKNAALIIQKHFRGLQKMRTSQTRYAAMRQATITIQAAFRGYRAKRNYARTVRNVTSCQSLVRTFLARRRFERKKNATLIIQKHFRGWQKMRISQTRYAAMRQATVTIQAAYREYTARRNYACTVKNVIICQSLVRTFLVRRRFERKKNAAMIIQKHFRGWQKMRTSHTRYTAMRHATVTIQAAYRGYTVRRNYARTVKNVTICQSLVRTFLARRRFVKKRNAALIIQKHFRSLQKMRISLTRYAAMRRATVTIQAVYRGYIARRNYVHTVKNVTICQGLVRTFLARRRFVKKKNAALIIQEHFRGLQKMRTSHTRYVALRRATVTIQAVYRGYRARTNYTHTVKNVTICQSLVRTFLARRRFVKKKNAALIIQEHYRAHRLMKLQAGAYERMRGASVVIQAVYRGYFCRKQYHIYRRAVIAVQSHWRMVTARRSFQALREASVVVQRRWKAVIQGRHQRLGYLTMRNAATVIQSVYRGLRSRRYAAYLRNVVLCQSLVRCFLARRTFIEQKNAAVYVQTYFRGYVIRQIYREQKRAATIIQQRWRAVLIGREEHQQYHIQRGAVITLQSALRSWRARKELLTAKKSAVVIQAAYRRHRAMVCYRKKRAAVVVLQKYLRATIEGKETRSVFLEMRRSAILVQSWWRMKRQRREYVRKMRAAITIQTVYRKFRAMVDFKIHKQAVVTLQRCTRAYLVGKAIRAQYEGWRLSTISIQSWWRMVQERQIYTQKRTAAITIQTAYRRYIAVEAFRIHKRAVVTLQRFTRAYLEGQAVRKQFQMEKQAAICIQAWWRMLRQQDAYQRKRMATIVIQTQVRMVAEVRKYQRERAALIALQIRWRANRLAREERRHYLTTRNAAIRLQAAARGMAVRRRVLLCHESSTKIIAWWRCHRERKRYFAILKAAAIIQTRYRAERCMRRERDHYEELRRSTIVVQSYFRVLHARMIVRREKAARLIQATYRMHIARCEYQKQKRSAVTIQATFRGYRRRARYVEVLRAAEILQRRVRAYLAGCRLRKDLARRQRAAIVLQSHYRGHAQRREYLSKREAVMKIQTWYRCERQIRWYRRMKAASSVIQRYWRSNQAMRVEFQRYHMTRGAVITIQAQVRCCLLRQSYLRLRASSIVLQKSWRGYKVRRDNQHRLKSAVCLQRRWRARVEGRQERSAYLQAKRQVVLIQSIYRAHRCRRHFLKQKKAASIIQGRFRGFSCRRRYREIKSAVEVIQKYWRAKKLANDNRERYLKAKSQVVLVQSLYRARRCRKDYLQKKSAVVSIQAWFRGHQCRQRYVNVKQAAVTIQTYWIARKLAITCRSHFMSMKQAAVSIQSAYRAHRCRRDYLRMKSAAVAIQSWFRGRTILQEFKSMRKAAVSIQRWYRRILLARRIKKEYAEMSLAALKVQRVWRGRLARRRVHLIRWEIVVAKEKMAALVTIQRWTRSRLERLRYLRLLRAASIAQRIYKERHRRRTAATVVLQSHARTWLAKKKIRDMQKAAITLQSYWRGRSVRKSNKSKKIAKARVRCMKATKAATEDKKLCNRTTSALHFLLTYKHLHQVVEAVSSLEVATRLSSRCCERLVAGQAVPVLFCLIRNCNRSLPCMEVIKYVVATLINLAKYHVTAPSVLDCPDSVAGVIDLMMIYRETNPLIATKATMLLTVLAQDNNVKEIITSTPKIDEKLRSLLHLQERKQKLKTRQMIAKSKSKGMSLNRSMVATPSKRPRPPKKFQPDWILGRHKRPDIVDPLEALKSLMNSLHVK